MFLNVPPFTRTRDQRQALGHTLAVADIADWNYRLDKMRLELQVDHPEAVTYLFDTYSLYDSVIANVWSQPETALLMNVTDNCEYYKW